MCTPQLTHCHVFISVTTCEDHNSYTVTSLSKSPRVKTTTRTLSRLYLSHHVCRPQLTHCHVFISVTTSEDYNSYTVTSLSKSPRVKTTTHTLSRLCLSTTHMLLRLHLSHHVCRPQLKHRYVFISVTTCEDHNSQTVR